ncbi:hypothetical protein AQ490_10615 [Wenjunlia vitaminophila]|uniref:Histidine kinase/HSP90-like ATPase domain-containing protein n=1 Tax=Wenjunlia vitaminophila TaxID=76728 RepID=A0A0T6LJW6_WENVI|nr:hypothetical protein AQ490_10615 [Wenjunlia vitaminophila]
MLKALRSHGVLGEAADSAALLVTELAGNAVEHAGGRPAGKFTVVLGRRDEWLRIEVRDGGRPLTLRQRSSAPEVTATAGRGLFLVQALSGSWGVRSTPGGKAVWCVLGVC